ncbi:ribonuclease R [Eggerthella timonensis]|uniref:ribonuclease R n=1 Tax=Eggerthella timonensis TaxID=1871008 RepID=UPI000C78F368|nr:ribonuclease R [Eggerthella timonensis]
MARTRSHTRRHPRSNPRGVLSVRGGGFGFVQTAEGEFFVPESKMAGAFDGDLVEVAPLPVQNGRKKQPHERKGDVRAGEKPAARVLRVVDRAHDTLVGRYEVAEPFGVVVPEDTRIPYDIFTMRADNPDVEDGSLVRVRITTFPSRATAATGVIEDVLGRADDERVAVDVVIARHKLETSFSEGALAEAHAAVLDEDGALASGYRDLRDRFTLTIDPADARDFDDAISIEPIEADEVPERAAGERGTGIRIVDERGFGAAAWRLGVHIADVSHYVPWNSSLDLDARRRATSVYLVDRVIPMLPDELSGDLCSLKPREARRTMTADLYLDDRARLVAYDLYPALIRSDARLSYDQAQALLDEPADDALSRKLATLSGIAKRRLAARERAGGLDFDSVEARVRLDDEGRPTGIDLREKTDATSLIEEAMILANETVALHLRDAKFPGLYRVHEQPSADSLAALVPVLQEFAWFRDIDQGDFVAGDPHVIQRVLAASAGRPEGELVSSLVLRSMKRAVYRPACAPHYGLASDAYTHFTSPIRRYPDLVVHRMLKALIGGRPEKFDQETSSLAWIAEHSSDMERVAEKAARESQELKMIEYLERFIGQSFSATVSGVATYGVYVRLDNTAEGLIPSKNLGNEYFALDPVQHRLTGQDTGTSYRLGQRLPVVLTAADPRARRLDFRPARPER